MQKYAVILAFLVACVQAIYAKLDHGKSYTKISNGHYQQEQKIIHQKLLKDYASLPRHALVQSAPSHTFIHSTAPAYHLFKAAPIQKYASIKFDHSAHRNAHSLFTPPSYETLSYSQASPAHKEFIISNVTPGYDILSYDHAPLSQKTFKNNYKPLGISYGVPAYNKLSYKYAPPALKTSSYHSKVAPSYKTIIAHHQLFPQDLPLTQAAPTHHQMITYDNDNHLHQEEHAPGHYKFSYAVEDHHTGDIKSHHEEREGNQVTGEYSLREADGTVRTVKYTAGKDGFHAEVLKSGERVNHQSHDGHH